MDRHTLQQARRSTEEAGQGYVTALTRTSFLPFSVLMMQSMIGQISRPLPPFSFVHPGDPARSTRRGRSSSLLSHFH